MRPLFLLSQPRSGSTLVQRVLGAHPEVATLPEPWIMLPLLSLTRTSGVRADYWHQSAAEAISETVERLDGGYDTWRDELRGFAERLYARAGGAGHEYFLDKTPRYHLIAHELMELFPDGRFVFLWRHPLAVVSSLLQTFRAGRFEPYEFGVDLYAGVDGLHRAFAAADARCHAVRYEDLLAGEAGWRALHDFLGLELDPEVLKALPQPERTTYGDPTGRAAYRAVSDEPLRKWRDFFQGPVRKAWATRYLDWIGAERMRAMGYDLEAEKRAVSEAPGRVPSPRDALHLAASRRAARARAAALALEEGPRPLGEAFAP